MRVMALAAGLLTLAACSAGDEDSAVVPDPAQECIDTHSVAAGYGHGTADLVALEAECNADGGTACAGSDFISEDAATCLAELYGLDRGILDYRASLVYHTGVKLVRWNVENTLFDEPGSTGGDYIAIHATDGSLLEEGSWEAME